MSYFVLKYYKKQAKLRLKIVKSMNNYCIIYYNHQILNVTIHIHNLADLIHNVFAFKMFEGVEFVKRNLF